MVQLYRPPKLLLGPILINGGTNVTAEADNTLSYSYDQFDITKKLSINGTTIVNAGVPASLEALATLINAQTGSTGVEAIVNPNGKILIRKYCR